MLQISQFNNFAALIATLPLVKHDTADDVGHSISHQQPTIKRLPFVSVELFCQHVDFLQALFLYRRFPNTKVAHARHGKFPG